MWFLITEPDSNRNVRYSIYTVPVREAIDCAVEECIKEGILEKILRENREEGREEGWQACETLKERHF